MPIVRLIDRDGQKYEVEVTDGQPITREFFSSNSFLERRMPEIVCMMIPEGVTGIDGDTLAGCKNLVSLSLPHSMGNAEIAKDTFVKNNLLKFILGFTVTPSFSLTTAKLRDIFPKSDTVDPLVASCGFNLATRKFKIRGGTYLLGRVLYRVLPFLPQMLLAASKDETNENIETALNSLRADLGSEAFLYDMERMLQGGDRRLKSSDEIIRVAYLTECLPSRNRKPIEISMEEPNKDMHVHRHAVRRIWGTVLLVLLTGGIAGLVGLLQFLCTGKKKSDNSPGLRRSFLLMEPTRHETDVYQKSLAA
jgi:hypothetical protein